MGKYDIFISYSSSDTLPIEICNKLEQTGLRCWIASRDIIPGTPYARAIMQGLCESGTVLVFISSNSLKSEDVLNEIDNAHSLKKTIIPIFIENIALTPEFSYYLKRKQWINLNNDADLVVKQVCGALGHPYSQTGEKSICSSENGKNQLSRKERYWVYLSDVGPRKLAVVKRLAETFSITLTQAKNLADNCDFGIVFLTLVEGIERFERLRDWFAETGATLTYRTSSRVSDEVKYEINEPERGEYEIFLNDAGPSKLAVVKYLKDLCGVSLAKAKEWVDNSRFGRVHFATVGSYKEFAEIRKALQSVGAVVDYNRVT